MEDDKTKVIRLEECYKRTTEDIKTLTNKIDKLADASIESAKLMGEIKVLLEGIQTNYKHLDYKYVLKEDFQKVKSRVCLLEDETETLKKNQDTITIKVEENSIKLASMDEKPTLNKYGLYIAILGGLFGILSYIN